jgi:hypothetical protein
MDYFHLHYLIIHRLFYLIQKNVRKTKFSIDFYLFLFIVSTDQSELSQLNNQTFELLLDRGTRYIVVDCGGGTVDITVHELDNKMGTLKELYKATGGPFGSVGMFDKEKIVEIKKKLTYSFSKGVDQEFEKLMNAIFGTEIMDEFKIKRPAGYVDLMIAFEARKRTASPFKNNPLNISLPFSFIDFYKKKKVF